MTTFHLIRHAEKDADEELLVGRTPEIGLSARGKRQAAALARLLAPESIQHIYCSPMQRARETAEPLAQQRALPVQVSAAFDEIHFGDWTGMSFSELASHSRWQQFNAFRSGTRVPGGEAIVEVQARFVAELLRLHEAFPDEGIAVISHADPIRVAIAYFLGAPLDLFQRIEISISSVSTIAIDEYGAKVLRMNLAVEELDE